MFSSNIYCVLLHTTNDDHCYVIVNVILKEMFSNTYISIMVKTMTFFFFKFKCSKFVPYIQRHKSLEMEAMFTLKGEKILQNNFKLINNKLM